MKDGKVESLEEAIALMVAKFHCAGQDCNTCPMNVDEDGEYGAYGRCGSNTRAVRRFLAEHFNQSFDGADPAVPAYDFAMGLKWEWRKKEEEPKHKVERDVEPCKGTCEACLHSEMHTSGIRFCKQFHNFVHEDGFCYRFESDKIGE